MSCTACPFHRIIFLRVCVPWQSNDSVQAYSTTKIGPQRWKLTAVQHNKWAVRPWSLNARPLGDADDPTRLLVFESVDKESPGSCATVEATLQQCLCQFLSLMAVPLKVLALRNSVFLQEAIVRLVRRQMVGSTHGAASRNRFAALLRVRLDFCNHLSCGLKKCSMKCLSPMEFTRIWRISFRMTLGTAFPMNLRKQMRRSFEFSDPGRYSQVNTCSDKTIPVDDMKHKRLIFFERLT